MKPENNSLERALRSVLFTGAITACAVSPMAMAQEEGDDEDDEDQLEIGRQVVTASRVNRIDLEEARPVVVITRAGGLILCVSRVLGWILASRVPDANKCYRKCHKAP